MTAPHLAHQTWAHAREGGKAPPMITYSDLKPYAFEIGEIVEVNNPDSGLNGMKGVVVNRRGGKPNHYVVNIPTGAPIPLYPFKETELCAERFLPIPLFTPAPRSTPLWGARDRMTAFGRVWKLAEHPDIPRRWIAHQKRVAAKQVKHEPICLPKWTRSTSREAVSALIKRSVRQDYIKHIQRRLAERQIARAA